MWGLVRPLLQKHSISDASAFPATHLWKGKSSDAVELRIGNKEPNTAVSVYALSSGWLLSFTFAFLGSAVHSRQSWETAFAAGTG